MKVSFSHKHNVKIMSDLRHLWLFYANMTLTHLVLQFGKGLVCEDYQMLFLARCLSLPFFGPFQLFSLFIFFLLYLPSSSSMFCSPLMK